MIPPHVCEGDVLSSGAVTVTKPSPPHMVHDTGVVLTADMASDTFTLGQMYEMEVAAEVVITTEDSEVDTCQCDNPDQSGELPDGKQIPQIASRLIYKRPTSLSLGHNTKHKLKKSSRRRHTLGLSIFGGEEPQIVEESKTVVCPLRKSFDSAVCEMEVGAEEEVVSESMYIKQFTECAQTTGLPESPSELFSDDNDNDSATTDSLYDSAYCSDGDIPLDPMSPNTENALRAFTRYGDTEILLPIAKRGPGFDLIDFITNDFPNGEEISSSSNIKLPAGCLDSNSCRKPRKCNVTDKRKEQPTRNDLSSMINSKRTLAQRNTSAQSNKITSKRLKRKTSRNHRRRSSDSGSHVEKRIKNNLSSKISRDKRKKEIEMKFIELELLEAKNSTLAKYEQQLKDAITKLNFEISQVKMQKSDKTVTT